MLDGHVLASLEVSTVELCEQHCLYHQSCSSINWKTPASGSANCQINEKSTENSDDNVRLSPSSEWTYKTTDYRNRNKQEVARIFTTLALEKVRDMTSIDQKLEFSHLFEISGESDGYRLKVGGYSGDAGDSLTHHNEMMFTTKDKSYCASRFKGAWWYRGCHVSNLNALHPSNDGGGEPAEYMSWKTIKNEYGKVTFSEMKPVRQVARNQNSGLPEHQTNPCVPYLRRTWIMQWNWIVFINDSQHHEEVGRLALEENVTKTFFKTIRFLLLLWLHVSLGYILRLPCKTYGNFSVEKSGFMLDGHVLASLEVSTVELCEQHCLYHQSCSSINWKTPASGSANCQINEKSTENSDDNVRLSPSSEWTYKTTDYRNRNQEKWVVHVINYQSHEIVRKLDLEEALNEERSKHGMCFAFDTYGNFSVEEQGFMLAGHVIASLEVSTVELCEQHCLYHQSCSSINWKTPTSGSANCQINEKSTENSNDNVTLSLSSEWTYKTTDYTERNFISHCTDQYFIEFFSTRWVNCVEAEILALSDTGAKILAAVQDSNART
eukprot:gene509-10188_t